MHPDSFIAPFENFKFSNIFNGRQIHFPIYSPHNYLDVNPTTGEKILQYSHRGCKHASGATYSLASVTRNMADVDVTDSHDTSLGLRDEQCRLGRVGASVAESAGFYQWDNGC